MGNIAKCAVGGAISGALVHGLLVPDSNFLAGAIVGSVNGAVVGLGVNIYEFFSESSDAKTATSNFTSNVTDKLDKAFSSVTRGFSSVHKNIV